MADHGHCSFGMVNGSRGKTGLPMIGQKKWWSVPDYSAIFSL
jgi:hypothetical protein